MATLIAAPLASLVSLVSPAFAQPPVTRPPVSSPATTPAPSGANVRARVGGDVFDSTTMRALAGAVVQLVRADNPALARTARSGADGAFQFDTVAGGSYFLGFFHPRMDSVLAGTPLLRVNVVDSSRIEPRLAIPSIRTILQRVCGTATADDSTGLFAGTVREANGGPPNGKARVRVQWSELSVGARGLQRRTPSLLAQTNDDGDFAVCGVPVGSSLMARAFAGTDTSGYVEFTLPSSGYLHRSIYVSQAERVVGSDTSRPSLTELRGDGVLRGTVRNGRGEPVPSARVSVWSTGQMAVTDRQGQYQLSSLPTGTFTLETRAIGFEITRRPVDILPGNMAATDIALANPVRLDTLKIRANADRASRGYAEFQSRKNAGFGYFLDESTIEKRQAFAVSDLLRTTPGIAVSSGNFGDQVQMRGNGSFCTPTVFVDGVRTIDDNGNLDALLSPQQIRGVEVYIRSASTPAQYQSINGCGSILIWTGLRGQ